MMLPQSMLRAFPPPPYLTMRGAGIDLSSGSVRSVSFSGAHDNPTVSCRKLTLPQGVMVNGDIENSDIAVDFLRSFRIRERVRFAHASLSEKKAFLYQTMIPRGGARLRDAVEFGLEEHVPIPPAEAIFDYEVINRSDAGTLVSVTVYAARVIQNYTEVFKRAGIHLLSLEVESHATARALIHGERKKHTTMIIDCGRNSTRLIVVDRGVVSFTTTIDVGGDAFTRAVMKHYNVSEKEAEQIKSKQGFLEGDETRDLYETLMTTVAVIKDEISGYITYWNSSKEESIPHAPIKEIVMVGGNTNLKGFPEFLSATLKLPVTVGNVWEGAFSLDEQIPPIPQSDSLEYATAVGLALRSR